MPSPAWTAFVLLGALAVSAVAAYLGANRRLVAFEAAAWGATWSLAIHHDAGTNPAASFVVFTLPALAGAAVGYILASRVGRTAAVAAGGPWLGHTLDLGLIDGARRAASRYQLLLVSAGALLVATPALARWQDQRSFGVQNGAACTPRSRPDAVRLRIRSHLHGTAFLTTIPCGSRAETGDPFGQPQRPPFFALDITGLGGANSGGVIPVVQGVWASRTDPPRSRYARSVLSLVVEAGNDEGSLLYGYEPAARRVLLSLNERPYARIDTPDGTFAFIFRHRLIESGGAIAPSLAGGVLRLDIDSYGPRQPDWRSSASPTATTIKVGVIVAVIALVIPPLSALVLILVFVASWMLPIGWGGVVAAGLPALAALAALLIRLIIIAATRRTSASADRDARDTAPASPAGMPG